MNSNAPKNPHASGVGTYANHAKTHESDQRMIEAQALINTANTLQYLKEHFDECSIEECDNALTYNRKLWTVFYDTAVENKYDAETPVSLRQNILNLSLFVFKHTLNILTEPSADKLDVLIDINRNIAAGLMQSVENTKSEDGDDTETHSKSSGKVEVPTHSHGILNTSA